MCGCRSCIPTQRHQRAGFVWLWAYGVPIRNIAVRSGTSITTVYRWIRRWQREGHVNSRPRSGRPKLRTKKGNAPVQLRHISSRSSWPPTANKHSSSPCDFQFAGWTTKGFAGQSACYRLEPRSERALSFTLLEATHAVYTQPPHHPDQRQPRKGLTSTFNVTQR